MEAFCEQQLADPAGRVHHSQNTGVSDRVMALKRSANFPAAWAPTCASRNAGEPALRADELSVVGGEEDWLTLTK